MKSHLKAMLLAAIIVAFTKDGSIAWNSVMGTNLEWFWGIPMGLLVAGMVYDLCLKGKKNA